MKVNSDIIRRRILDKHPALGKDAAIGVVSSFCQEQSVADRPNGLDITLVATTQDIDLDREVVKPEGADTSYFFNNRSIFVDHYYDFEHCVGKLRSALPISKGGVQTGWRITFHLFPLKKNPFAADIETFARDNALACSIGFNAIDAGKPTAAEVLRFKQGDQTPRSVVRAWEWLELSITMFPCNVMARQVGFSASEEKEWVGEVGRKRAEYLRGMLSKGRISEAGAAAFGLKHDPSLQRRRLVFVP